MRTHTAGAENSPGEKIRNGVLWALQILLALAFLGAALPKLRGELQMVATFGAMGLGQGFRYLTAVLELGGAIALLIPAFSGLGGLLLAGVMLGAAALHLFKIGGSAVPALVLMVLSGIIAWGRWPRTVRLLRR